MIVHARKDRRMRVHLSPLACIYLVAGTWMAAVGKHHISVKVQHPLQIIWEELEYVANTLVFVLAGVIIAGNIYQSSAENLSHIRGVDYVYALLLWVYLLVSALPRAERAAGRAPDGLNRALESVQA